MNVVTTTQTVTTGSQSQPTQSTSTMQMTTSSYTSGSVTTVSSTITQSSSVTQGGSQSSSSMTTATTIVTYPPSPTANLLNIKYESTTSHNWYFSSTAPMINDSGSSNNFLNVRLSTRWPNTQSNYFPTNGSTSYFTPVGVTNSLPPGFSLDTGLYQFDTPSLSLPGNGNCLQLFNISTDFPYNSACLRQPETCEYGFSAAVWLKFQNSVLQNMDYILTAGPDGVQGFKFYHQMGQLYIIITGRNTMWTANVPFNKNQGTWSIVAFSWRRSNGLIRLLVGDQFTSFNNTMRMHNLNLNPSTMVYLGCMQDLTGSSDPTCSSSMSIAHIGFWFWAVRQKELLSGDYVYKMVRQLLLQTTATPTTAPLVVFDFSKVINEVVAVTSSPNPYYYVADEYVSVSNVQITTPLVTIATGGFRFTGSTSYIQRKFSNGCPSPLSSCSSGLSLGMWLKIPNTTNSGDIFEIVNNIRIAYLNNVVTIIIYNGSNNVIAKSTSQIIVNVFQNLGITYLPSSGQLKIYINGIEDTGTTWLNNSNFARAPSSSGINDGDFILGSGTGNTLPLLELNDIILWKRYLFSTESHRFVGYTKSQFNQLQNATNYWTTDTYINLNAKHQLNRTATVINSLQLKFALSSVLKMITTQFAMDNDPYLKSPGQCPILQSLYSDHLFLARSKLLSTPYQDSDINWSGLCLTDPCQSYCRYSGITVSMWIKIKSVSMTSIQFFFNSGDMADYPGSIDARGISIFTDQQLFGISLSTCTSDWNIIIDANQYQLNQWMNIGLLWREDLGLTLLINGVDYGLVNKIPTQIYKPNDLGYRAVAGRFDTDDQTLWRSMGYWVMSNFVFGEMSYYSQYMTPDAYTNILGMVNSVFFIDATVLRLGNNLINPPIQDLILAKNNSQSYNYEGQIDWFEALGVVKIIFGRVPIIIDLSTCPTVPNACVTGFSIGGWFFITPTLISSLVTPYNLIVQGNINTNGFGIMLFNNNSIYAWVRTDTFYSSLVPSTSFYANINQWIFLGFIWQKSVGITLLINGKDFFSNSMNAVHLQTITDRRVFVGDNTVNTAPGSNLLINNVVMYNYTLNLVQLQKLIGIQYNQVLLLNKASIFWSVYGMQYKLIQKQIQMFQVTYIPNKYDTPLSAICTMGSDQSYMVLQTQIPHCLQSPDRCTSFVLIMNVYFYPLISPSQSYGMILTVGNNQTGVQGVSIIQTSANTMEFYVRNSTTTCKSVMSNFTTGTWVQLKFLWSSFKNQIVKVNENTMAPAVSVVCISESNNVSSVSDITIGRNPMQTSMGAKVSVSEVMLMHILTTTDPDSESSGLFSSSCYQNMDLIFTLNGNAVDQYQMPLGATTFTAASITNVLPLSCLTSPSTCSNGLTISIWVKVDQIPNNNIPMFSLGQPPRYIILISLSAGTNASTFSVFVSLNTGTQIWSLTQDSILPQSVWTNIGMTWNYGTGLNLFINGRLSKTSTATTLVTIQDPVPTSINLGNTISGNLDNLVIWFKVVASCQSPQLSSKALIGSCKTDTTIPVQVKCNVLSNCNNTIGSICIDETPGNVIQIANSGIIIKSPSDANIILTVVIRVLTKTTPSITNLTIASASLLVNVANNLIMTDPLTMASATSLLNPVLAVNSELMTAKYSNDWVLMDAQNITGPLIVINITDSFYLRIAKLLSTTCSTLSVVQGSQGLTLLKIDARIPNCNGVTLPNYADNSWTQNATAFGNPQDIIQVDGSQILANGPVISFASSLYGSSTFMPSYTSSNVNPNSLILTVNSRILTIKTFPTFPRTSNQTMITVQFNFVAPNVRPSKVQAWDVIDPPNPILQYKWFSVYWNHRLVASNGSYFGSWDTNGCTSTSWNTTYVVFTCNHMSSFAVIMQPIIPVDLAILQILAYVTLIGLVISLICLLIFIITILVSKSLNGTRYIIHLNMAIALFFACIAFILVQPAQWNQTFCQAVGLMMHLFFVAKFGWMLVEALFVFYAITTGKYEGRFKCYVPLAWGLPILIVAATAGLSLDSYGRNKFCWLTQNNLFLWSFLGPVVILLFITCVVCLIVACNLSTPAVKGSVLEDVRDNIKQTAYTIPFMLLGWVFGIVYILTSIVPIAFVFVILCSLEGLWILIFFGLMNRDFRLALCRKARERENQESEAILDGIETQSQLSLKGKNAPECVPPPKTSAPIYYTGNPRSKPPRHMNSVEFSRTTINSERNLINDSYEENEYNDYIDTNTIQNNGIPSDYARTIPGTPHYEE